MQGEQVIERDWGQTWRLRGECLVCGVYGYLVASCGRCRKWSCERVECVAVVKERKMCAVPVVSI